MVPYMHNSFTVVQRIFRVYSKRFCPLGPGFRYSIKVTISGG